MKPLIGASYLTHRPQQLPQHSGETGWERQRLLARDHPTTKGQRWAGGEPQSTPNAQSLPCTTSFKKKDPRTWTTPRPSASTVDAGHEDSCSPPSCTCNWLAALENTLMPMPSLSSSFRGLGFGLGIGLLNVPSDSQMQARLRSIVLHQ